MENIGNSKNDPIDFLLTKTCQVSAMSQSFTVPVSTKLRLCQPPLKTVELALRLEAVGASWITLHARMVSARRRRRGAADLTVVAYLKERLRVPVISNGNVRIFDDLQANLDFTGADGLMVGETLLGNPWYVRDRATAILPATFSFFLLRILLIISVYLQGQHCQIL